MATAESGGLTALSVGLGILGALLFGVLFGVELSVVGFFGIALAVAVILTFARSPNLSSD